MGMWCYPCARLIENNKIWACKCLNPELIISYQLSGFRWLGNAQHLNLNRLEEADN